MITKSNHSDVWTNEFFVCVSNLSVGVDIKCKYRFNKVQVYNNQNCEKEKRMIKMSGRRKLMKLKGREIFNPQGCTDVKCYSH